MLTIFRFILSSKTNHPCLLILPNFYHPVKGWTNKTLKDNPSKMLRLSFKIHVLLKGSGYFEMTDFMIPIFSWLTLNVKWHFFSSNPLENLQSRLFIVLRNLLSFWFSLDLNFLSVSNIQIKMFIKINQENAEN